MMFAILLGAMALSLAVATAGLAIGWARRRLVVVLIEGSSMQPTYGPGDRVLVLRTPLPRIQRGQVVVLRHPDGDGHIAAPASGSRPHQRRSSGSRPHQRRSSGSRPRQQRWIIKRAAALPGDPFPVAVTQAPTHGLVSSQPIPDGWLAVLGDNAPASDDSRQFGLVPGDSVLGIVVRKLSAAPGR